MLDPWFLITRGVASAPARDPSILLLAEKSSGDIAHIRFLQLVVLAAVAVDTHKDERLDHGINVEAHVDEPVYQVLVIPLVPANPAETPVVSDSLDHPMYVPQTYLDGSSLTTGAVDFA